MLEKTLNICNNDRRKLLKLYFTDILGELKCVNLFNFNIKNIIENGVNFDGSSIQGMTEVENSDLTLRLDLSTFRKIDFPFYHYICICDIFEANSEKEYNKSPRYILKKQIKKLSDLKMTCLCGIELEFFVEKIDAFMVDNKLNNNNYFSSTIIEEEELLLYNCISKLYNYGINIECYHNEVGENQFEFDFKYNNLLKIADNLILAKNIIKKFFLKNKYRVCFEPKKYKNINGNGLHTHISLYKDKNLFHKNKQSLKYFINGILDKSKEITLLTNYCSNSLDRLVLGFEAPTDISYGKMDRTCLIRIPSSTAESTRIECRNPDPSANPYLYLSAIVNSGLYGIKNKLEKFSEYTSMENFDVIKSLPNTYEQVINYFKESKFCKELLGKELFESIIKLKENPNG